MRFQIFIALFCLAGFSCSDSSDECILPDGESGAQWIPFGKGNTWRNFRSQDDNYPVRGYSMHEELPDFGDSLELVYCSPNGFSALCTWIWGRSKDGQRLYRVCSDDYFSWQNGFGSVPEFRLELDFSLAVGDRLTGMKRGTVVAKSTRTFIYNTDNGDQIEYLRGYGHLRTNGKHLYDEVVIGGQTYDFSSCEKLY